MKTIDMEIAVSKFLNYRQNIIVPNISWGLNLHECDLLVLTKSGFVWEVEIKICKYDLKNDRNKRHGHRSNKIKRLYFAIPSSLIDEIKYIPEKAGILEVLEGDNPICRIIKKPVNNKEAIRFNTEEKIKLAHLGTMRIWSMKKTMQRLRRERRQNVNSNEKI